MKRKPKSPTDTSEATVFSPGHRVALPPGQLPDPRGLSAKDFLLLAVACLLWDGVAFVANRTLTTHETTHCQNTREMFEDRQFLFATYGRRPWLERPSVPQLLTGLPASLVADVRTPWALRVGPFLAGTAAVLALAWAAAGVLGRTAGLLSGVIFATMREYAAYTIGPEADIFLASAVTIAGSLFIRGEFGPGGGTPANATIFGRRPWPIILMYAVLGATNAMKGPLFGTAFLGVSMAAFCFLGRNWPALRRWVTFWGWLAYFAVGGLWPLVSMYAYPDIPQVWRSDYGGRWGGNFEAEPWWYYLTQVPWNLFPWTLPAFVGLAVTARRVFRERDRFWQFVWAWALTPPVVFSLFQGKHHHYMLNCMAPWAPLALAGTVAIWQWLLRAPAWRRSAWFAVLAVGVPGAVLALVFADKIPGPAWVAWAAAGGWVVAVGVGTHFAAKPSGRTAFIGVMAVLAAANVAFYLHRAIYLESYGDDLVLLRESPAHVPPGGPVYVLNEYDVLNPSWLLFYEPLPTVMLHNMTYLASDQITEQTAYVIGRRRDETGLSAFGQVRVLAVSAKTRVEKTPEDRYTLFEVTFTPGMRRHPEPPMSALQALGRADGPTLPAP